MGRRKTREGTSAGRTLNKPIYDGDSKTRARRAEFEKVRPRRFASGRYMVARGEGVRFKRSEMQLPPINEVVPLEKLCEICLHYGLPALWAKIERDPPAKPFASDGCTGWFNEWRGISLYAPCFLHDVKYWCGYPGEHVERLVADAELMIDIARALGSIEMAEVMFRGVRLGGQEGFRASFSWGFGRA